MRLMGVGGGGQVVVVVVVVVVYDEIPKKYVYEVIS